MLSKYCRLRLLAFYDVWSGADCLIGPSLPWETRVFFFLKDKSNGSNDDNSVIMEWTTFYKALEWRLLEVSKWLVNRWWHYGGIFQWHICFADAGFNPKDSCSFPSNMQSYFISSGPKKLKESYSPPHSRRGCQKDHIQGPLHSFLSLSGIRQRPRHSSKHQYISFSQTYIILSSWFQS